MFKAILFATQFMQILNANKLDHYENYHQQSITKPIQALSRFHKQPLSLQEEQNMN